MQQTVGAVLAQLDDCLARMLRQRRHKRHEHQLRRAEDGPLGNRAALVKQGVDRVARIAPGCPVIQQPDAARAALEIVHKGAHFVAVIQAQDRL